MAATLPHNANLKLEQALGQWRQWHCDPPLPGAPHIEHRLPAGHSNWSVLVNAAGRRFVVRIDGIQAAANGINRHSEWRVLQAAHRAGCAPCPRYFNPELGVLVCDYLPHDEVQATDLAELATLLRSIHQLPPRHQRLHLGERLLRYEKLLQRQTSQDGERLESYREKVWRQLQHCEAAGQPSVLCHNDLLQANRLYSGGKLYALDWEYSAMASPWYELAVICCGDALTGTQQQVLVEHYLQRSATEQEQLLLQRYSCVYRYLELAWYLAQERQALNDQAIAARYASLASALTAMPV